MERKKRGLRSRLGPWTCASRVWGSRLSLSLSWARAPNGCPVAEARPVVVSPPLSISLLPSRAHASLSVRPRAGRWVRLGHEALPRSHGSLRQGPSSPLHLVLCPRSCLLLERANQFLSLLPSLDRSRVRKRVLTTVSTRPLLGGGGDLALRIRCFSIPARIFGTLGRLMGSFRLLFYFIIYRVLKNVLLFFFGDWGWFGRRGYGYYIDK